MKKDEEIVNNKKEKRKKREEHFEKYGLFSITVETVPPLKEGEKGKATAWSAVWRILIILGVFIIVTIFQARYYCITNGNQETVPGILGILGIDWSTGWKTAIIVFTYLLGVISIFMTMFRLTFANSKPKISIPFIIIVVVSISILLAIMPGNAIGETLYYYELYKEGFLKPIYNSVGIMKILPWLIVSILSTIIVLILWLTVGKISRRKNGKDDKVARWLYAITPFLCAFSNLTHSMNAFAQGIIGVLILALFFGEIMPNELMGASFAIRTKRPANCLWIFSIVIFLEIFIVSLLATAIIYQM